MSDCNSGLDRAWLGNTDVCDLTLTLANCAGSCVVLNGPFTGLAALNDGTSPRS